MLCQKIKFKDEFRSELSEGAGVYVQVMRGARLEAAAAGGLGFVWEIKNLTCYAIMLSCYAII